MKKTRVGIALTAMLAFLISAAVPGAALAADTDTRKTDTQTASQRDSAQITIVALDGDLNCIYPSSVTELQAVDKDGRPLQDGEWSILDAEGNVVTYYPAIYTEDGVTELIAGPRTPLGSYTIVYQAADGGVVTAPCQVLARPAIVPGSGSPITIANSEAVGVTVSRAGTSADQYIDILDMIPVANCSLRILTRMQDGDGELSAESVVYTGSRLQLRNDTSQETADTVTIIVTGDVLGTGVLSLSQLVRMAQALDGSRPLQGVFLKAGDFTGDGNITLTDLVREAQLYTAP